MMDIKHSIGDIIYLKTDTDQHPRMITNLWITAGGVRYGVVSGIIESYHYDFEMSLTKNIILTSSN